MRGSRRGGGGEQDQKVKPRGRGMRSLRRPAEEARSGSGFSGEERGGLGVVAAGSPPPGPLSRFPSQRVLHSGLPSARYP